MWDIGDVLTLTITIKNAFNQPENATEVTLTITSPDGTIAVQTTVSGSVGVYTYNYTAANYGRHHVRWVATGTNAGSYTDVFDVRPNDNGDFISLTEAKDHMRMRDSDDDEKLRGFVSAACQMIVDRMGPVAPVAKVYVGRAFQRKLINLPWSYYPIMSVTGVWTLPDNVEVAPGNVETNTPGWVLADSAQGFISYYEGCFFSSGDVRVELIAGRNPVPANYRLAAQELTAHLWRMSQLNSGGGRPPIASDDALVPGTTYALPYTVRQLLGLDKRARSGVMI